MSVAGSVAMIRVIAIHPGGARPPKVEPVKYQVVRLKPDPKLGGRGDEKKCRAGSNPSLHQSLHKTLLQYF